MLEFKCPLCKQDVSQELYEKITGIWKERKIAEKQFKEKEKELVRQKKESQKQLIADRKRLKGEQKAIIEKKLADKTKQYNAKMQRIENEKNRMKERFDKKIESAVKSAERQARKHISQELKSKLEESVKKQVEKATSKTQGKLLKSERTIEATRKQMFKLRDQNIKQQQRIGNLEIQLKNRSTPQLEGLLYEDKLLEALIKEFPNDKLEHPGKKGDIVHCIMCNQKPSGLIVYECKRVSQWQNSHIEQTAKAKLDRQSDYAILVTNASRKGSGGFFIEKGVIVVTPGGVIAIATILREQVIKIAQLNLTSKQREDAIKKTLEYLQGPEFNNSIEVVIRKTREMYEDLKKETVDHRKNWEKRYDSLKTVYLNSAQIQVKTTALIAGQITETEKAINVQPFPALPLLPEPK